MEVRKQIELGLLVCPRTGQRLYLSQDANVLENRDKTECYRLLNGVLPILLADEKWAEQYAGQSGRMTSEYSPDAVRKSTSLFRRVKSKLTQDYRTEKSREAFSVLFDGLGDDALCLSVGGGPQRSHPRLTNLNIGPFPNVDVVADAHCLPYADGSVDTIHCEAVFEHLHTPALAAREMYRVLKPGGRAYVCTPFLQGYHGYPHHYQNFTLTGHCHLFESAGFSIVEAGTCIGPVYTMVSLTASFLATYPPYPLNYLLRFVWGVLGILVRPLDRMVGKHRESHLLASGTYAIIQKVA